MSIPHSVAEAKLDATEPFYDLATQVTNYILYYSFHMDQLRVMARDSTRVFTTGCKDHWGLVTTVIHTELAKASFSP